LVCTLDTSSIHLLFTHYEYMYLVTAIEITVTIECNIY